MPEKIGWGADRISFSPDEVRKLNSLVELNGSVYDALRSYLANTEPSKDEILRLVYIIENRKRMMKTIESIARGVYCESYGRVKM